jgi:predicted RNA-binding protein YlqC (UPF0109 family)
MLVTKPESVDVKLRDGMLVTKPESVDVKRRDGHVFVTEIYYA